MYQNFFIEMNFIREIQNVVDQAQAGRFQGKSHFIPVPSLDPGHMDFPWVLLVTIYLSDFII